MRFGIRTLDDISVAGKTVLCRIDINEPIDRQTHTLLDTTRIRACVPTIRELSDNGARLVLLAHQGSDIEYENFFTTKPHAAVLAGLLDREVRFIDDVCGPAARAAITALGSGEILLLDNVRFLSEEQTLFEFNLKLTHKQQAQTLLVQKLAPLADFYLCDAFAAAHRDQPSLCGFQQVLPSAMGRLFEREFCVLSRLMESPRRPCTFVLGGAKIDDAFRMMRSALERGFADRILTGGLVAQVLLWASGQDIGEANCAFIDKKGYAHLVEAGQTLLQNFHQRIQLPVDVACVQDGARVEFAVSNCPNDLEIIDIGTTTAAHYQREIRASKTVFVNGPVGIFEQDVGEPGTKRVWEALGDTPADTVVGGGDSIAATAKYGKTDQIDYLCTGGGALIRFLSGEELPVIRALRHGSARTENAL